MYEIMPGVVYLIILAFLRFLAHAWEYECDDLMPDREDDLPRKEDSRRRPGNPRRWW